MKRLSRQVMLPVVLCLFALPIQPNRACAIPPPGDGFGYSMVPGGGGPPGGGGGGGGGLSGLGGLGLAGLAGIAAIIDGVGVELGPQQPVPGSGSTVLKQFQYSATVIGSSDTQLVPDGTMINGLFSYPVNAQISSTVVPSVPQDETVISVNIPNVGSFSYGGFTTLTTDSFRVAESNFADLILQLSDADPGNIFDPVNGLPDAFELDEFKDLNDQAFVTVGSEITEGRSGHIPVRLTASLTSISAIPEPSASGVLAFALAGLLTTRRKKRN